MCFTTRYIPANCFFFFLSRPCMHGVALLFPSQKNVFVFVPGWRVYIALYSLVTNRGASEYFRDKRSINACYICLPYLCARAVSLERRIFRRSTRVRVRGVMTNGAPLHPLQGVDAPEPKQRQLMVFSHHTVDSELFCSSARKQPHARLAYQTGRRATHCHGDERRVPAVRPHV